jgi:hypothetical protein
MAGGKLMNRNRSKDKPDSVEDLWQKAFGDMCKSLDKFGEAEILDLLVTHSRQDVIVNELLSKFPSVVALGNFLSRMPVWKVSKRTLKRLEKSRCLL